MNKKSQLSLKNKLTLIKAIIRLAVLYASTAWGHAADTSIHRIQAMENKLLRMALDAPWFVRNAQIYRDLEWKPFRQALKEKAEATYRRAEEHPYEELRKFVNYDVEATSARIKRPRHQLAQVQ
ncbi:hypothetical protein D910_09233 [Dendroctonus ponderosae]|uniref:Uncharacterized protein n=1 Tax=Dendroctonus ponderosae TaxID=77166 RepID=U4UPG5_DENPD|nr:hypothetical protein D910_09233 [Dendroctonus ponderosae]